MFCIDYLLGYSSPSRKIVFLIRTGESVGERGRGPGSGRDTGGPSSEVSAGSGSLSAAARTNTHTHTLQQRNVSDPAKWMAVGLETSAQLCNGLSLGENPLAAADCALEHNPNKGVFTLNVYRHPSYELRFISSVEWIHCAQRLGQGRVFSEAICKWNNSS